MYCVHDATKSDDDQNPSIFFESIKCVICRSIKYCDETEKEGKFVRNQKEFHYACVWLWVCEYLNLAMNVCMYVCWL